MSTNITFIDNLDGRIPHKPYVVIIFPSTPRAIVIYTSFHKSSGGMSGTIGGWGRAYGERLILTLGWSFSD